MKKIIALLLSFPLVASCAAATPSVTIADLTAGTYVLQSVNGEAFSGRERTPEIQFDENMRVAGQVCNRFMGQATLKDGVLTAPQLASTMMLCVDPRLNEMERTFAAMLREGAQLELNGDNLTLRGEQNEFIYTRK
jgi:Heat shock protein